METYFGSKETVIKVEPANHRADIERAANRIELIVGPWDFGAIGNHGAFDDGAQEPGAFFEAKTLKTTPDSIDQAKPCSFKRELRSDRGVVDIVGNVCKTESM